MNIRGKLIELRTNDDGTITLTFDCKDKREFTLAEPSATKPNTVMVDRGLLRDAHNALNELLHPNDYIRKLTLSLSFALNKDR